MRDWSPPDEAKKRVHSVSPVLPLASVALAIIFIIAAACATFNGTRASTIASRAQSQFAAASADTSFFDRAAQFLLRAVCPIFRSCEQYDVRSTDSQNSGGANQAIARQPAPSVSTPSTSSGQASSPPAASTSFASTLPAAGNFPVAERVIERIVERALPTYTISYPPDGGGVSETILNDRLDQLENKLSNQIFSLSASLISIPNSLPATGGVTNTIALTQRIDNLDGTDISNPTITGGTITDATISGGNITATALSGTLGVGAGGTGLSTAPSQGQLLMGQADGSYALVATSSLGIDGGITPGSDAILSTASTTNLNVSDMFSGAELTTCNAPGSKLVYNASTKRFECSQDLMGSGGAGVWSTTTNSLAIAPASASYVVLVGTGATTTDGNILEVNGSSLFRSSLTAYGTLTAPSFVSTSTATSTFAGGIELSGGCLAINGICITMDGSFSTTSADHWESGQWRWSTSSAQGFEATQWRWATTSSDYWKSVNNFFSTTSADAWDATKAHWSTTSANYFESTQWRWSTTSSDIWDSTKARWSTSSASYFLSQNQPLAFGTSSSDFWLSQYDKAFFFSTTSADWWGSTKGYLTVHDGTFSTTSADWWKDNRNFGLMDKCDAVFAVSSLNIKLFCITKV